MRRLRKTGLVAALAALAACGRCGGAAGPPPERFVPANAVAALLVPEIRGAARSLAEFYSTASDFPGTSELPAIRGSLSAQLGFDPFDLGSLREAGIDPHGGMAVAFLSLPPAGGHAPSGRTAIVVLPVSNRAAADARVRRIAAERLGATERKVEAIGAIQVAVYRPVGGGAPALSVGDGEGCFVLSAGPSGPAAVASALSLDQQNSLSASPAWQAVLKSAGDEPAAVAFVPAGSQALEELWPFRDGAAVSLSAEPGRLRVRAVMLLGEREPSFRALIGEGGGGGGVTAKLDPAAAFVGRWDGDPAALGEKLVPMIPATERARLAKAGVELQRDLFSALAPGGAASLSLAPRIDLARLDTGSLRGDPLRLAQFELLLPLHDPARLVALSERLLRRPPGRGRGQPFSIPTASGEVAWTIDGDWLVAAGGAKGRLSSLRARMAGEAGGYRAPTDAARRLLAAGGLGAVVFDTQNFTASVRALPPEAFGTGPTGFVMRSLAERIVEPAARIDAAALRVELAPGALVVAVEIEPKGHEGTP